MTEIVKRKPNGGASRLVEIGESQNWDVVRFVVQKRVLTEEYRAFISGVSDMDFARLAAYIDGEGSLQINQNVKLVGRMKNKSQNLNVIISNTNVPFIEWLKSTFGGSVYFVKYEKCKHLGKKQVMRWQVNDRKAELILSRCLEYMIIKKPQAEVGLAFMKLKRQKGAAAGKSPLSPEEISQRDFMRSEIQRLNQSGGAVVN